jgi:hypothetical protein
LRSRLARSRQVRPSALLRALDEETRRREIERFIEDLHQVAEMLQ